MRFEGFFCLEGLMVIGLVVIATFAISFYLGWFFREKIGKDKVARAEKYSEELISSAKQEASDLKKEKLLEAEETIYQNRLALEQEKKIQLANYKKFERQLNVKENNLDRKVDILNEKEKQLKQLEQNLKSRERQIGSRENELIQLVEEQNKKLQLISGLTSEEAKKVQLENILNAAREEAATTIKEIRDITQLTAKTKAREIVIQAIQRTAISHVVESTVSVVNLPNDDMKGRIIGREGRNIRAFEATTGVEVLIDDTPEIVMLSGFDPIRREIAKLSLEKLIYDGRIHPGRIEEVVEKSRQEIDEKIFEYGEQALVDVGLYGIHHDLVKLIGQLKFHTSQGQNVLQHSIEVAILAGLMASELELDTMTARRAGLLHETGYAIDNYSGGTISELSADLVKKYSESEEVQNAILYANSHEIGDNALSPITILVSTANEISKMRPGAEKEILQKYFSRLSSLEEIANSFIGVTKSYAIQAGREIRVIVGHSKEEDIQTDQLAISIAQKIKANLSYPGQIKINVLREYRSISFAS
jgi:ribonuclease Y